MDCSSIYEPEPDVAGQAVSNIKKPPHFLPNLIQKTKEKLIWKNRQVFIAFLAHTVIFLFLALVITPIVQIHLPLVPSSDYEIGEVGGLAYGYVELRRRPEENMGVIEFDTLRIEPAPLNPFAVISISPQTGIRPASTRLQRPRRMVYRCYCKEAIESTYTSRYIAGVAFAVTAFVKHDSISYYHLRVIYCLLALNTTIGLVTNFGTASKIKFLLGISRKSGLKWKMIDLVLPCNMIILFGFSVYLFCKKDGKLSDCYKHRLGPAVGTLVWFLLLAIVSYGGGPARSALQHVWFSILVSGFVAFQGWQIQDLARTFRTKAREPGKPDERSFTVGQILVLFMIVPLISDFSAALIGIASSHFFQFERVFLLKCWAADLRKFEKNNWRNGLRSFINLFLVLFPDFLRNFWDDTCAAIQRTFRFLQLPIAAIRVLASKFCQIGSSCTELSHINLEIAL